MKKKEVEEFRGAMKGMMASNTTEHSAMKGEIRMLEESITRVTHRIRALEDSIPHRLTASAIRETQDFITFRKKVRRDVERLINEKRHAVLYDLRGLIEEAVLEMPKEPKKKCDKCLDNPCHMHEAVCAACILS